MQYAWDLDAEEEEPTSIEMNDQPHYELVDDDLQHQGTMTLLKIYVCNWQTFSFTSIALSVSSYFLHLFHIMMSA